MILKGLTLQYATRSRLVDSTPNWAADAGMVFADNNPWYDSTKCRGHHLFEYQSLTAFSCSVCVTKPLFDQGCWGLKLLWSWAEKTKDKEILGVEEVLLLGHSKCWQSPDWWPSRSLSYSLDMHLCLLCSLSCANQTTYRMHSLLFH